LEPQNLKKRVREGLGRREVVVGIRKGVVKGIMKSV